MCNSDQVDIEFWNIKLHVAESPFWDQTSKNVFLIDIRAPKLIKLDLSGNTVKEWALPSPAGAFALLEDGKFCLVCLKTGIALIELSTEELVNLKDPEPKLSENRLNEGKVSQCGNWFVFGSMDDSGEKQPTGSLYSLSTQGSIRKLDSNIGVTNGIAWSPDSKEILYSDTLKGVIWRAKWDQTTGTIRDKKVFAQLTEQEGYPDGAAMDIEGNYWHTCIGSGSLVKRNPEGKAVNVLSLPFQAPTMPCFIPDLKKILITSHRKLENPASVDGCIALLKTSAKGAIIPRFRASAKELIEAFSTKGTRQ